MVVCFPLFDKCSPQFTHFGTAGLVEEALEILLHEISIRQLVPVPLHHSGRSRKTEVRHQMLKRLWLLLSSLWLLLCLYGGSTRPDGGLMDKDLWLGFAPFIIGWLVAKGLRFVVTGSPLKPRGPVPYRRP